MIGSYSGCLKKEEGIFYNFLDALKYALVETEINYDVELISRR